MQTVFICAAKRTPIGALNGTLSTVPAPKLGAAAIEAALKQSEIPAQDIDEVLMGCVLTAGLGQAPARQASLFAGLPPSTPATTLGKVCGSGLKAVMLGTQAIQTGDANIVIAGGMENMSQAPHLLEKSRTGYRLGHQTITDSMIKDGLWDVYNQFHMGNAAELCVKKYRFSKSALDEFSIQSYERALWAQKQGWFQKEMVSCEVKQSKNIVLITQDEEPTKIPLDKITSLKPAFEKTGSITAGNASKLNDGAAALVLVCESEMKKRNLKPLARVVASAQHAQTPEWFTTAPVQAIQKVLKKANLKISDIDLFEINEAFAAVTLAAIQDLKLSMDTVNIHGGAVALGHPIGASGARILTTLLYALEQKDLKRGLATLCIGGGEAVAMIIER